LVVAAAFPKCDSFPDEFPDDEENYEGEESVR
jgi:hypothetical protein